MQLPPLQPQLTGVNGVEGRDLRIKLQAADSLPPARYETGHMCMPVAQNFQCLVTSWVLNTLSAPPIYTKYACHVTLPEPCPVRACRSESDSGLKRLRFGHAGLPGVQVRLWDAQGTQQSGSLSELRYRSLATHIDVKLREHLDQCAQATAAHLDGPDRQPHKLRTSVCCQMLRELSQLPGPFSSPLQTLCTELVCIVVSSQALERQ